MRTRDRPRRDAYAKRRKSFKLQDLYEKCVEEETRKKVKTQSWRLFYVYLVTFGPFALSNYSMRTFILLFLDRYVWEQRLPQYPVYELQ